MISAICQVISAVYKAFVPVAAARPAAPVNMLTNPDFGGGAIDINFDWDRPRVVEARGLSINERNAEWIDKDGDRWRWNNDLHVWQNMLIDKPGLASRWYNVPTENGDTSELYAPYVEAVGSARRVVDILESLGPFPTEIFQASSTNGEDVVGAGHDPVAEERPASVAAAADAGQPNTLSRNDLMDAARAVRVYSAQVLQQLRPHWDDLATRIEFAAIVASQ